MQKLKISFLLCLWFFSGFTHLSQAQIISPQNMLSNHPNVTQSLQISVPLYFRYRNTGYLAREMRELNIASTISPELAVIQAIADGPGSIFPNLSPLFPPGTQVLNITGGDETLFVTFNEKLLGRFSDEALIFNADYIKGEGRTRRRLTMAGLVNTITECFDYTAVQVLVRRESNVSASMRLNNRYYLMDDDFLPPPLTRQEEYILTPQISVTLFLDGWRHREFASALRMVHADTDQNTDTLPTDYELQLMLDNAPRLSEFSVTPGTVSTDGQSAVVSLTLRLLRDNGEEELIKNRQLKLILREGIYIISVETYQKLMNALSI